jgi:hypothetical protein
VLTILHARQEHVNRFNNQYEPVHPLNLLE